MPLVRFMATPLGRGLRVVAGIVLIMLGLFGIRGPEGMLLAFVGVVPLCAGLLNVCLLAPLFGGSIQGIECDRKKS